MNMAKLLRGIHRGKLVVSCDPLSFIKSNLPAMRQTSVKSVGNGVMAILFPNPVEPYQEMGDDTWNVMRSFSLSGRLAIVLAGCDGEPFKLTVGNQDATPAEIESKGLKFEKVATGGATVTINVRPVEPGSYEYFDAYQEDQTNGAIIAE
jgi:hypothetical protein